MWWLLLSHSVMSNSLQPHGLQRAGLRCPSLSPRVCSNSCPLSRWCHPTILSSVAPSPPALNLSQHQVFSKELAPGSGGRNIRPSASTLVFPVAIQDCSPLELTGLISLLFRALSRVFSSTTLSKASISSLTVSLLYGPTLTSI